MEIRWVISFTHVTSLSPFSPDCWAHPRCVRAQDSVVLFAIRNATPLLPGAMRLGAHFAACGSQFQPSAVTRSLDIAREDKEHLMKSLRILLSFVVLAL